MLSATSGCQGVRYLRGASDVAPSAQPPEAAETSFARTRQVVERAYLTTLAEQHRTAFPVSVAKMLLGIFLLVASGRGLVGRPGSRMLALQAIGASAALEVVEFVLMQPVHDAVAKAMALDAMQNQADIYPWLSPEELRSMFEAVALWAERLRFAGTLVVVYGGAAFALTRAQSKAYFAAMSQALRDQEPS